MKPFVLAALVGIALYAPLYAPLAATAGAQTIAPAKPAPLRQRYFPLVGYGLVIGLPGTGDDPAKCPMMVEYLKRLLDGQTTTAAIDPASLRGQVAAVMITAQLPPDPQVSHFDVQVSSMCDAKSLAGGALLTAPLLAADDKAYALTRGTVAPCAYNPSVAGEGCIVNGAVRIAP